MESPAKLFFKSMVFVIFVDFSSQVLVETLKAVRELFLADLLIYF